LPAQLLSLTKNGKKIERIELVVSEFLVNLGEGQRVGTALRKNAEEDMDSR